MNKLPFLILALFFFTIPNLNATELKKPDRLRDRLGQIESIYQKHEANQRLLEKRMAELEKKLLDEKSGELEVAPKESIKVQKVQSSGYRVIEYKSSLGLSTEYRYLDDINN